MIIYVDKTNSEEYMTYKSNGTFITELPTNIQNTDKLLTQNQEIYYYYNSRGQPIEYLSDILNRPKDDSIYNIYNHYFEGKILSDRDMLDIIFNGLLKESKQCYCLKVGVTFCWFSFNGRILTKKGTMQFSEVSNKYTVGKFIKRLQFNLAKSGFNLSSIHYLVWHDADIINTPFEDYIKDFYNLHDLFKSVKGLNNLNFANIIKVLSNSYEMKLVKNAELLVDSMIISQQQLGLFEVNNRLVTNDVFYMDYSKYKSSVDVPKNAPIYIIIDCEGKKGKDGSLKNGIGELGGLVSVEIDGNLYIQDTFMCDEVLLEPTLKKVFTNIKQKRIKFIVYGESDEIMLKSSITNVCSKLFQSQYLNKLEFKDIRSQIYKYMDMKSISKLTLTNIAKYYEVMPIYPKHIAVNDAKTLFNIIIRLKENYNIDIDN